MTDIAARQIALHVCACRDVHDVSTAILSGIHLADATGYHDQIPELLRALREAVREVAALESAPDRQFLLQAALRLVDEFTNQHTAV